MLEFNEHVQEILDLDLYDEEEAAGTLSATTLCRSAREIVLLERYADVAVKDDGWWRVWSILGSLLHLALEMVSKPKGFKGAVHNAVAYIKKMLNVEDAEERLKLVVMGEMISGKYDFVKKLKTGVHMSDYKFTGTYGITKEPYGKIDWVHQLSINRYLYFKVKGIMLSDIGHVYLILRDWVERFVTRKDYPNIPIGCLSIGLMSIEDTETYITNKLKEIKRCREMKDNDLPLCSDTWQGRKCERYCLVRDYCNKHGQEGISL